jgi:hypothetical protein
VVLLWLPSAVAVAALHANPCAAGPPFLAALAIAEVSMALVIGFSLVCRTRLRRGRRGEALLCTWIGMRVLGAGANSRHASAISSGLFAAALAGAPRSALIVYPFRPATGLLELARWFLSECSASSSASRSCSIPPVARLRQPAGSDAGMTAVTGLALVTLTMFAGALVVLHVATVPLCGC